MLGLLDNIIWHTLTGPHARFATGTTTARRFAPGFSPILGFAAPTEPDLEAIAPFCEAGEHFYCAGWTARAPAGWTIDVESTMFQLVWDGDPPAEDAATDAVFLDLTHAKRALDLATLTHPGPFGPRTLELGDYLGIFMGDQLVAMAGERMHAGNLREISGVCTHPAYQGRGFARRLMVQLIRRELRRGEVPFLHVMRDNASAWQFYERMGFRRHREIPVRVISCG